MLSDKQFIEELRRITSIEKGDKAISEIEFHQQVENVVARANKLLREMMWEAAHKGQGRLRLAPQFFVNLVSREYVDFCIPISELAQDIITVRYTGAGFDMFGNGIHEIEEIVWDDSDDR